MFCEEKQVAMFVDRNILLVTNAGKCDMIGLCSGLFIEEIKPQGDAEVEDILIAQTQGHSDAAVVDGH